MVNALLSGAVLFKRNPDMVTKSEVITILKTILATLVMAFTMRLLYGFTGAGNTLVQSIVNAVICGGIGIVVYGVMLILLKVEEVIKLLPKTCERR